MNVLGIIATYLSAAAGTLVLGLTARWVDRKVTAAVQYRVGPPWYQPAADILKLLYKETLMPATARGTGFLVAPAVALAAAALAAAMLWSPLLTGRSFGGDLIVIIYLLLVPPIATMLGAAASGNPHATVGASREMKLLLSYELPLWLALLVGVVHGAGSFWSLNLADIVAGQQQHGVALYSISGAIAFVVALLAAQAKLGQVPFDVAEAECEIMSGVYVEYSGPPLALIYMTRNILLATTPLLLVMVLWGGMGPGLWGVLGFIGKYVVVLVLLTLIRNTNPRLRIDQIMRLFWLRLAPLAAVAVILALAGRHWAKTWV